MVEKRLINTGLVIFEKLEKDSDNGFSNYVTSEDDGNIDYDSKASALDLESSHDDFDVGATYVILSTLTLSNFASKNHKRNWNLNRQTSSTERTVCRQRCGRRATFAKGFKWIG